MKVRNSKIIQFDTINKKATLNLTQNKKIGIDQNTVFASKYATGLGGFLVIQKEGDLWKGKPISIKAAKVICKYLTYTEQYFHYDYFKIDFDNIYI